MPPARPHWLISAAAVLSFPTAAFANYPTPGQQLGLLHGFVLNPVLGVICGWLIARVFKSSSGRAKLVMIMGVTISMWTVSILDWRYLVPSLEASFTAAQRSPLDYSWTLLWLLVAAWSGGFALLMIPWAAIALQRGRRSGRNVLGGAGIAATVNIGLIVLLFGLLCNAGLFRLHEVNAAAIVPASRAERVYFISAEDGNLWRVSLDGKERSKVADLPSAKGQPWYRLYAPDVAKSDQNITLNVVAYGDNQGYYGPGVTFARSSVGDFSTSSPDYNGTTFGPVAKRDWRVGFDAATRGMYITNKTTEKELILGADVPFLTWDDMGSFYTRQPNHMTVLENGVIVCQIGMRAGWIVLIDPQSRAYSIVARGFAPFVATSDPISVKDGP